MNDENRNINIGNVKISEDVIASIVTIAACEAEGVTMAPSTVLDFIERWGKKSRGIKVQLDGESVSLDVAILIGYGVNIPQTALKVQQKIKEAVESMTGLKAQRINVTVAGINVDKEKKATEA